MVTNHTFAQVNADDNALRFDEPHNFSGYFPAPAAQVEYSVAWARAKQLQNRGAWLECLKYLAGALSRDLPGPLFTQEALRMRGIAAWHVGDDATARIAFTALGKDAPPGRALEAARWLERLR